MTEQSPSQAFDYHPPDIDKVRRFSELTAIEIADPTTRVEAFKATDPMAFLDTLSVMNGLLQGKDKFTRWEGPDTAVIKIGNMSPELHPPDNPTEKFLELFKSIQENINDSQESIDAAALKLYFGIIGVHMFKDANGRTARSAFHLLRHGALPKDDATVLERSKSGDLCEKVNVSAVVTMLEDEGLPKERIFDRDFVADDSQNEIVANYGLSQHLRYIAVRRLKGKEDPSTLEDSNPPEVITLDTQSQYVQDGFAAEFSRVRDEWFERFTTIPTKHPVFCLNLLDPKPADKTAAA